MQRTAPTTLCALALTLCLPLVVESEASADLLSLHAETRLGGAGGKGMFGEREAESFHQGSKGLAYGVILGAEVFFVDAWIEHNQYPTGDETATWTQFMLGMDATIELGDLKSFDYDEAGKKKGGYASWFAELGMGFGFGVGTGQQVKPPLDNSEVTDKGFLFEARGAVGYRLTSFLSLGLAVPVQLGYFTKSGEGATANNVDNHYSSIGASALFNARIDWSL